MKTRIGPLLAVLVVLAAAVALAVPVLRWLQPPPQISDVSAAMEAGRFDEAQRRAEAYIAAHPDDPDGHLLLAHVLIQRPDPQPAEALEQLGAIRTDDPKYRAVTLVQRGKALYRLDRMVQAEAAWKEALRLDPMVAEAGWQLLDLYYLQGREAEARALALAQFRVEPNPRDREGLLRELVRMDVEHLAAAGVIPKLEPAVAADPDDVPSALALGRAQVREGQQVDEGLALLAGAVERHPDDAAAWRAYLGGLVDAADNARLAEALGRVPAGLRDDPGVAEAAGVAAMNREDFAAAVERFSTAVAARPFDPELNHRMAQALKLAGRGEEAAPYERREADVRAAAAELKPLFDQAQAESQAGRVLESQLCQQIADLRERMGHPDEALAWHRLVLEDRKEDPTSLAAVERLAGNGDGDAPR